MKIQAAVAGRTHEVVIERGDGIFLVTVDGVARQVDAHKLDGDFYSLLVEGRSYHLSVEPNRESYRVRWGGSEAVVSFTDPSRRGREDLRAARGGPVQLVSVMPGKVVRVLVSVGDAVEAKQGLVVVEAMKMENEIGAPRAGRVSAIHVEPGRAVEAGAVLIELE